MRTCRLAISLLLLGVPPLYAQTAAPASAPLPVKRVVLYKTGVGYFEHLGRVRDTQDVVIRFTSSQLNDVVKSLTAIDLANGRITGISYNSNAPLEQRLASLRLPLHLGATTLEVLSALKGARVEVGLGPGPIQGRVLSVERREVTRNDRAITSDWISIVTDGGEIRTFELTPSLPVRIIERDLRQDVSRWLDVVSSQREQDVRRMVISTSGSGERQLFASYISEVPIWKSTYRLVLPDKAATKPLLQGWAVVDNTTGEDWANVELSLVAGAPQSFIQNISQPYYGRRPEVALPQAAQLTPQTHQGTLESGAPPPPPPASPAPQANEQIRTFSQRAVPGGVVGGVVGGLPDRRDKLSVAESVAVLEARASAQELGDLFEYRIKEPVTLMKNQSALVPIMNAQVTAEKVAIWNPSRGNGRPLRGVWITNASGLTLDGGSITVIDANAFAGEGLIDPVKPGERRLLSYAVELGVLVRAQQDPSPTRIFRARARDGILIQDTEDRLATTYTARNENDEPVSLIIEHRGRPNWKLADGAKPEESTLEAHRFRVVVQPRQEATLTVREVHAGETRFALGDITEAMLLSGSSVPKELLDALKPVFDKRGQIAALDRQLATLQSQREEIDRDQNRLRENMKALRGSAEEKALLQRYTRQLDEQESRLDALRTEIAQVTRARDAAREELARLIASISFEVK